MNPMNAELYEIDYSCSPGGINMWGLDIRDSLYHSSYAEFRNPAQALNWMLKRYPASEINLSVRSLDWYHGQMSVPSATIGQ
jgi:hypothetical protein